jgi:PAS domain S-box-containing protein
MQDALRQPGKVFNIPLRLHRKKDGTVFPIEITARAFLQDGEPVLLVSCRDITERKRVEAELLAEKTNSEAMFESSPIALFVLDDKTNIVRVNTRAVDMFGGRAVAALQHRPGNALGCVHSSEDPRGCGYSTSCPLCPVRNGIQALLANGGEINGVDVSLDLIRDGEPQKVWMEIGAKFVQLEGRRHVCIAMVDITARKQAEAEQQESNERFQTLFDSSPDPVWIIDNQRFVECNQAAIEMLGYPDKDSLKNIHPSELSPQFQPDGEESYSKAERMMLIAKEKGLNRFEWVHRRRDQSNFFAEVTLSAITLQGRQVLYCMWRDVTERKQAAEAATQLANAKNKFIAVVSHELRSPLATIKEATSLVREEVLGPINDEQKDMLNITKSNIDRLGRLVNNVLIYQKIDAGKMLFDILKNDVNEITQEAYRNIILADSERKDDLVLNLAPKLPRIKCDKDKIMQVLLNLISNGIKYSERGPIVITTQLNTREIEFSVKDSGQGIYPEEMENVFLPFSHGPGRKTGGTGLGLAISKEIILAHNGQIWVESEFGKGSTFYFTVPL